MKKTESIIVILYVAVCAGFMIVLNPSMGIACLVGAAIAFILSLYVAFRHFGGVTEDTAGFFVQICEVLMPLAALLAYKQWW